MRMPGFLSSEPSVTIRFAEINYVLRFYSTPDTDKKESPHPTRYSFSTVDPHLSYLEVNT